MNYISFIVVWGWLAGFYLNIIYETAFDSDQLPQIYLGTSLTFLWEIIKPILIFSLTFLVTQIPFLVSFSLLKEKGINYENIWQIHTGFHLLLQVLFILGLFLFPIAILTIAVGKDFFMLRPDYLIKPIFKAFITYLTTFALLAVFCILEMQTKSFDINAKISPYIHVTRLIINLFVQVIAILAMRSIGLFYRHYACYFEW